MTCFPNNLNIEFLKGTENVYLCWTVIFFQKNFPPSKPFLLQHFTPTFFKRTGPNLTPSPHLGDFSAAAAASLIWFRSRTFEEKSNHFKSTRLSDSYRALMSSIKAMNCSSATRDTSWGTRLMASRVELPATGDCDPFERTYMRLWNASRVHVRPNDATVSREMVLEKKKRTFFCEVLLNYNIMRTGQTKKVYMKLCILRNCFW